MIKTLAFRVSLTATTYDEHKAGVLNKLADFYFVVDHEIENPVVDAKIDALDMVATVADDFAEIARNFYATEADLTYATASMRRQALIVCRDGESKCRITVSTRPGQPLFNLIMAELADTEINREALRIAV